MDWIIALCVSLAAPATAPTTAPATLPSSGADGAADVVIVVGAEGDPEFGARFVTWADRWADAAGAGGARVTRIGQGYGGDGSEGAGDDKDRLRATLESMAEASGETPVWLVLIGHGTFDGREAKFNLEGPDVSDSELAAWLAGVRRPVAVINTASASAPFVNRLAAEGRVVVTATRSGHETNFARFGEYLSSSVADASADLDKDGQTSLLEAFLAASHGVQAFYRQDGRLPTEHALLDDTGDGLGVSADWFEGVRATRAARDDAPIDGSRAHQWHLVPSAAERAMPPELRQRRDELELAVEALRRRKGEMVEFEYYDQLEDLLLQLALVYREAEARRGE